MDKITKNQLTAMLLITDAFALFCFHGHICLVTALGFLCGTVIQFVMSIPLVILCNNGGSVGKSGKIIQTVYFLYLVLWGGMLFSMLWQASDVIYIPYENNHGIWGKLFISGLVAVVCLYSSSTGIRAVSRASVIACAVGAVCLLIVAVSAFFGSDWENILRTENSDGFFKEILRGFVLSGGLGSFAVLLGHAKGNALKNTLYYFTGKIILTAVITLSSILVAGGIMKITDFPIVTSAQLSQPFPVQRIDSLFLIIFAVFAVFSIAVQSLSAGGLLMNILPSFRRFRTTSVLILMIGSAFLFSGGNIFSPLCATAVAVILLIIPLTLLIKRSMK